MNLNILDPSTDLSIFQEFIVDAFGLLCFKKPSHIPHSGGGPLSGFTLFTKSVQLPIAGVIPKGMLHVVARRRVNRDIGRFMGTGFFNADTR